MENRPAFPRRRLVVLKEQEIGEGRLRALDLGREQRLLADIHAEKQGGVGRDGAYAVESAERQHRLTDEPGKPGQIDRRLRRQWFRHIGAGLSHRPRWS